MKILKNLKPTEIDANFIYSCPSCDCKHWLSLKEARTKGFIVVCDCDKKFKVTRIKKIKIVYDTQSKLKPKTSLNPVEVKNTIEEIPLDLLNTCCKVLIEYGFTEKESEQLLKKSYRINPTESGVDLIKFCLKNIGEKNNA